MDGTSREERERPVAAAGTEGAEEAIACMNNVEEKEKRKRKGNKIWGNEERQRYLSLCPDNAKQQTEDEKGGSGCCGISVKNGLTKREEGGTEEMVTLRLEEDDEAENGKAPCCEEEEEDEARGAAGGGSEGGGTAGCC